MFKESDFGFGFSPESSREKSRKEELLEKERKGLLSREEEAELQGLLAFPDNPEAARLLMKDVLGQTTEEEKEKLRKYFQRKQFSPEVNALWDRVEENDPNVELVEMSQGKAIEVSPSDPEKIIWTHGLGGCIGCLVFAESQDGTRFAILTHYPTLETYQNLNMLRYLINKNPKIKENLTKLVVLVMAPGEYVKDPVTKKLTYQIKDKQTADLLSFAVKTEFELKSDVKVDVKLEPYRETGIIDEKDQGTLIVRVPPSGKGEATYKTWFSAGTL